MVINKARKAAGVIQGLVFSWHGATCQVVHMSTADMDLLMETDAHMHGVPPTASDHSF